MQTPWLNHSWHVVLYVTPRGLTTAAIPYGDRSFQLDFDFLDHGPGPLEQGLGDEEAEPHADMLVGGLPTFGIGGARGDEGLAELFQHIGREAVAVVGNDNPHLVLRPARLDFDLARGKVDGVLHQIAQAIEHA